MARPYRVVIQVFEEAGGGRQYRREWRLPEGVELTLQKLSPAANFILDAVAELDNDPLPGEADPIDIA